ncbi:6-bladed beta-propeller [Algoriphagus sp. NG3]|uniref:6-bladed beta-propeller n=1 Tax=Algoriphagus sp. NG3 TaxID=3097546 RepID=UPI002A81C223|nr:6-bladed beta-propeller [Algoriphagus sp. NG3]WPR74083.1 6-bladed beta-propeller [Algoriphagus sp. NG3]
MRRFLLLIVSSLFLIVSACNQEMKEIQDVEVKEILVDIKNPKSLKMSQLFDTCYIIPLDDRELIGNVDAVDFDEDQLLILDSKKMYKAYLYDWKGEFIKFLANEGEGPGEFKWPRDAQLIDDEQVVIYSAGTQKLLYVDRNSGKTKDVFLDSIPMLSDFKFFDNKYYFLRENKSLKNGTLLIADRGLQDFKEILIPEKFLSKDLATQYRSTQYDFISPKLDGQGFYFSDVVSPYFLEYKQDSLYKAYLIKFSDREVSYDNIEGGTDRSFRKIASRENLFYFSNELFEAGDYLFLYLGEGNAVRTAVYDKRSEKSIYVNEIEDDLTGLFTANALAGKPQSGFYVEVVPAEWINELVENSVDANPYLDLLRKATIKRDDNPVLFIYRFKEDIVLE